MNKILNISDRICLFCGQPEKEHWDEYEKYYECDCKDAVETRKIKSQIDELKRKLPQPKYEITNERVLHYAANVLRLYDGRQENLIINRDLSAAIAKPLLAAGLSHKLKKK